MTENFNGNAWDEGRGLFYFSRFDRLGPEDQNPLPSLLFSNDLAGRQVSRRIAACATTVAEGAAADASFSGRGWA